METQDKITKSSIQNEALQIVLAHKRCSAGLSVGLGKTKLGLEHMQAFYSDSVRYLVVAPKNTILQSWKDECTKFNVEYLLPHIKFTTYLSLNKHNPDDYDIIYLDEAHSLKEDSHELWLNAFSGRILGLSGTLPRNIKSEKGRMIQQFCPSVYNYKVDKAIENDILNDYRIVVHKLELSTKKDFQVVTKKGGWLTSERDNYEYWTGRIARAKDGREMQIMRTLRMKALQSYTTKETYVKKLLQGINQKCLLFANTQAQADKLCSHSVHSKNPDSKENLELFKNGTIKLLSAVEQLSEGINIPDLSEIIIMHTFGGDSPKAQQKFGRCVRLSLDKVATIHLLMYSDCQDEVWVNSNLEHFDSTKISYI